MEFPFIPSGTLFTGLDPAKRNEYFRTLADTDSADVPPQAVFGRNGWLRRTEGLDRKRAAEEFRASWAGLSPEERFDWAYGNALDRSLEATIAPVEMKAASDDFNRSVAALSGGRRDNLADAVAGRYDPDAANRAMFRTIFGG